MPWPTNHKDRTRERIVQTAAAAFRARGVSDVSVEQIMSGAGLTHGGFYAHFASKGTLLDEALEYADEQTLESLSKILESLPAEQRLGAIINAYLSPVHAEQPAHGCLVAALGPELARSKKTRQSLVHAVKRRLEWMRGLFQDSGRRNPPEEDLYGAVACMLGGLILARSAESKDSATILEACRKFLHRALSESVHVSQQPRVRRLKSDR